MQRSIVRQAFLFTLIAVAAGSAGWYAHEWHARHSENRKHRWVASRGYEFTSPLLDVELPEGITIDAEPQPFRYKVAAFVKKVEESGQANQVAVYYRDLHDGPWFCINPDIEFNPASMMKVPVMVAWLKRAEKNPIVIKRRIKYEKSKNPVPEQYTKPARTLIDGQSYSVDELLHYMMNYSDNRATSLLYKALGDEELGDVLDNMDINNNPGEEGNSLTIHGYSGFFRILYNASYLNREMSEKALRLLSLDDFPQGIAAGVPGGGQGRGKVRRNRPG